MFKLTGLNGDSIFVSPATIFRVRPGDAFGEPRTNEVEYAGGYVFTREEIDELLNRLHGLLTLVPLTARSGVRIYINPAQVTRIRRALELNGPGTELVLAGRYQHVIETVDEVSELIGASGE